MIMANGSSSFEWQFDYDFDGFDLSANDDESVDFQSLFNATAVKSRGDYSENGLDGPSSSIAPYSEAVSHNAIEHSETYNGLLAFPPPQYPDSLDFRTFCSSGSFVSETQAYNCSFEELELNHNIGGTHRLMDQSGLTYGAFNNSVRNDYQILKAPDNSEAPFMDLSYFDISYDPNHEPTMPCITNEPFYFGSSRQISSSNHTDGMLFSAKIESEEHLLQNISRNNLMNYDAVGGVPMVDWNSNIVPHAGAEESNCLPIGETSLGKHDPLVPIGGYHGLSNTANKRHMVCLRNEKHDPPVSPPGTAQKKLSPADMKSFVTARTSTPGASHTNMPNKAKPKTNDEQIGNLVPSLGTQQKSEISLTDGGLAVTLLRHQRIALSWMTRKETKNMRCCGGILADDQGLGKTISAIALILNEKPPASSSAGAIETKEKETETLNLDEDEDTDVVKLLDTSKQDAESHMMSADGSSIEYTNTSVQPKCSLAAGTLVVCPTSVLRQWNEELQNKVSSEANLSVLVYYGGNRTKDPLELAKYDVVLTTYAIVSMEVPKQPLDEDDDQTKKRNDLLPIRLSPTKKRKYPPSSDENSKKDKKGTDNEPFESIDRPLAKLRWFRVILDEAQSIKNYKTKVARACWGLRAKRRWCLSGTPIQNSIDDLYSYFRFLRYDPFAVFKSFCSAIKAPIQRNPVTGYKKLQVILKTIMLRRTKRTLLKGKPIISLPPKTIILKKVDFTAEERGFYRSLEAKSRALFAEYAAAGTLKQNYVNILLMLLRLRQACDHPLLVRECSSSTNWRLSVEKAKDLPREKLSRLLNCLEASLAICGICNDPPEDGVVTTCEHVFCNQCILEHLSCDDSQCPSSECKMLLSRSSVFCKSALEVSMHGQPVQGYIPECSGPVQSEVVEPCSSNGPADTLKIEATKALDSSKIKATLKILQSISKCQNMQADDASIEGNQVVREKAIVFSQWTRMLDLLEVCLKDSSISYRRLDGTMSVVARDKAVKDFNTLPEVTVMIMSLKAACLGLNMVAACHVILLDLWWNPTTEDQAIDRAHRIGQTRPVTVYRFTVKDTIEDRILALQQKKREMVASAFGDDENGGSQTRLTVDDMKYLFQA